MNYNDFLAKKLIRFTPKGIEDYTENKVLFEWQNAVTKWALKSGSSALFEDCGLGKTGQQLAWAIAI